MSDYLQPDRICDLVMKGGITSGVVYPPAIDQIARRFWLRGIGGTSAGAIAAALAAAAELRRRNGSDSGYLELKKLPKQFGGSGQLLALFKPDGTTRPLFELFLRGTRLKDARLVSKLRFYADIARIVLKQSTLQPLVDNNMGLCTGMANGNRTATSPLPPLTEWLSKQIDEFAGITAGVPLTFRDLWTAPNPSILKDAIGSEHSIELQLISTCLTFGRPYALPHLDNRWAFHPEDFLKLFPKYVVDYMIRASSATVGEEQLPKGLFRLPVGASLPVIVAVRMSLSFPALFSMVPLYYPDYRGKRMEKVYFADGGITSNLPIHFFDSPFPRWPTLAINLQYAPEAKSYGRASVEDDGVYMTRDNRAGILELSNRFLVAPTPIGKVFGFVGAIFRAAQTWTDNSFLALPGYRDRVAEIWLEPNEGGMNLEMPPTVIAALLQKGDAAGRRLVERFASAPATAAMSWDGHRWTRFRAIMPAIALYLRSLGKGLNNPLPGDRAIWQLLETLTSVASYPFRGSGSETAESRRHAAEEATKLIIELID